MSTESTERPYIGVGVLVWKGDKLLLGKRISPQTENGWQFPGGHLEIGETVSHCANREVSEEVGIKITDIKHLGYTNDVFTVSGRHYVTLFVSARYLEGDVRVMEPDKCECWDWFECDQLPQPLFLPISNYLKQHPDLSVFRDDAGIPESAHR